ncbi:caspase family protein [Winogradskyella thalassocola]|uniref:WD40 repeat n=1 Tax=Winogradskyella thalassocola TaxID=262004 RepID=A0A1G7YYJ0_9FLAO|nr:caspase family protein [Winogradskyella thalassocola]SDH00930.1 WD40 repeat [Winogradskyella thalassocola]
MEFVNKKKLIFLIVLLISFIGFTQNQTINYSSNENLNITSFDVSGTNNKIAINVFPLTETIIYDGYTGNELNRLKGFETTPRSVQFDDNRNLIIVEYSNKINVYNSIDYTLIITHDKPDFSAAMAYSSELGKLIFSASGDIVNINVTKGDKEIYPDLIKKNSYDQSLKISKKGDVIAHLDNGKLSLFKDYVKLSELKTNPILDFTIGENTIVVLSEYEPLKLMTQFYDFNGNPLTEENRYQNLYKPYSYKNTLTYVNEEFVFYGAFKAISLLTKDRKPYKYQFQENFSEYQFIRALGFVINYGNRLDIVDVEGRLKSQINVGSIYNQSGIFDDDKEVFSENNFVLLSEDKLFFSNDSEGKPESMQLQSPYVNGYSNDKNLLAFVTRDNMLRVWDIDKKQEVASIAYEGAYLQFIQLSKANNIVVVKSQTTNTVKVYDLKSLEVLDILNFDDELITSLDLNEKWLAVGTSKGDYYTWQVDGSSINPVLKKAKGLGNAITSIKIFGDDVFLASMGRIVKFSLVDDKKIYSTTLKGHESYIQSMALNDSNQFLVSSSIDGSINLWDLKSEHLLETYSLDATWVNQIKINKDLTITSNGPGNYGNIISASELSERFINSKPELIIQSSNATGSRQLRFSPDGKLIASIDGNKIKVREVLTGFLVSEFITKNAVVNDFVFDKDGQSLIVATGSGIQFFDHLTGKSKKYLDLSVQNRSIHHIETFNNHNVFIANNIHGWHQPLFMHSNSGVYLSELNVNPGNEIDTSVINIKISDNDKMIATYGSHYIKIFTVNDQLQTEQIVAIPRKKVKVSSTEWNNLMDFSPSGSYLSYLEFEGMKTVVYDIEKQQVIYDEVGTPSKFGQENELLVTQDITGIALKNLNKPSERNFISNKEHISLILAMDYDPNEKLFATADSWGNIKIWNSITGKTITEIDRFSNDIYTSELSPSGNFIAYSNKQGLFLFNLKEFKTIKLEGNNYPYFGAFSKDNNLYYFRDKTKYKAFNLNSLATKTLFDSKIENDRVSGTTLSKDGTLLIFEDKPTNVIHFYNLKTNTEVAQLNKTSISNYTTVASIKLLDSEKLIIEGVGLTNEDGEKLSIELINYNIKTKVLTRLSNKRYIDIKSDFKDVIIKGNTAVNVVSSDKAYYTYQEDFHLKVEDLQTNKILYDKYIKGFDIRFGYFTEDNKELVIGFDNGTIQVLDTSNFKLLKSFEGVVGDISKIDIKGRFLMVLGENDKINVFDIKQGYKKIYSTAFIGNGEFLIANDEGYYYASKGATENVAFKKNLDVFPFEQFDLYYNRPDKASKNLVDLGIKDKALSEAYYKAYLKRLKNIGFSEAQISGDLHLPTLSIVNDLPVTIDKDSIDISVLGIDHLYQLDRINIWVNDVPIFGSKGKNLKDKNLKRIKESYKIALTSGSNKIEVSVTNIKGSESLRSIARVNCEIKREKPALYLVSIGVSNYADTDFNLKYAAKDALDISAYTEALTDKYSSINTIKLLNEEVTIGNVMAIKKTLNKTEVSDVVVVFFAGHGLLDDNFDYYLATHNIDFNNPSENGLSYENLEGLLDGIPARKKLLLIDACHSGEIDKDDTEFTSTDSPENVKVTNRGSVGAKSKSSKVGLKNSFELMQMLFADLRRGTGAMVISSASGVEFAYEGEQWENGVFTYALLEGLKSGNCDVNKDNEISVSELRNYVIERVDVLTNGRQNPTARKENLEFDFKVW